jgi:diacylglycerol kinase family enzyme
MKSQQIRKRSYRPRPVFNVIVNQKASDYSRQKVRQLLEAITRAKGQYFIAEPDSPKSAISHIKYILNKKPSAVVVCGGDGTVNLVARNLIRRKTCLGIVPMGRFNNIYRSLYGEPDMIIALGHIISGKEKKIDAGVASGKFFLGSVAVGLIPEVYELLQKKRTPRFSIGWSRMAAQAAASAVIKPLSAKIDEFQFNLTPQTLGINLLPYAVGLPLVPACVYDDGKCEVVFDAGKAQAIMSGYIRQVFKRKYLYSDEIRMFRGKKVSISPLAGRKMYIDGEIMECRVADLEIEVLEKRIRVLFKKD